MKPIIFTDDHKATVAQKTDPMFVYFWKIQSLHHDYPIKSYEIFCI
jgi:hypothetical protein